MPHASFGAMVILLAGSVLDAGPAQDRPPQPIAHQPGAAPLPTDPDRLPDVLPEVASIAHTYRVTPMKGVSRPFALAFLPDGTMLVTERAGRLRVVRNGVVDSAVRGSSSIPARNSPSGTATCSSAACAEPSFSGLSRT